MSGIYDIKVKTNTGEETTLAPFKGQVLLIVNVASNWGFTPQYAGLQKLFEEHREKGFQVLGFPCNQFGAQEPGTDAEIKEFCSLNFGATFPLFQKIEVNGPGAHPLYEFLKSKKSGILGIEAIKWNFTKFLVSRSGEVVERYAPQTKPEEIAKDIHKLL